MISLWKTNLSLAVEPVVGEKCLLALPLICSISMRLKEAVVSVVDLDCFDVQSAAKLQSN